MSKKNWLENKLVWLGACVGMLCMGLMACATSEPAVSKATPSGFDEISEVRAEKDGASTVVVLGGLHGTQYTAYPDEDFNLVVVEVPSVTIGSAIQKQLSVYDGVVREVTVAPFTMRTGEPLARVEIALAADSTFEVVPSGDHLKVRITPASAVAADATSVQPLAATDSSVGEAGSASESTIAAASANAPVAKTLKKVDAQGAAEGTVLRFLGDGKMTEHTSFVLTNPERLVIDLVGIKNQASPLKLQVNSAHVAAVRIGVHADKVRVVIDGGSAAAPFEGRWIVPTNDGLLVTLGSGAGVDAALAAANSGVETAATSVEEPAVAPMESTAETTVPVETAQEASTQEPVQPVVSTTDGVQVYGVSHERLDTVDRVVISTSQPVEYRVFKPNAETVMLSLIGAQVSEAAAGRITPEHGGSVAMVSTFQQPDLRAPEVRVVITRASGVEPQITRDGSMIVVDVANQKAAALPPAVAQEQGTVATTDPARTLAAADGGPAASVSSDAGLKDISPEALLIEGGMNDKKQYTGKRISLDFKDAEISSIMRLIADVSNLNVIAGDDVKGQVTIRLIDIPWDQALDVVLATKGLGFTKMGNVIRVAPQSVIKAEEAARMQEAREREKLEELIVQLIPINYGDAKDVEKLVKKLLTNRGTVNVDKRTNTVIIKDIQSVVSEAVALARAVDTQTPQVLVEAKVVEASMDFSFAVGTRWGVGQDPGHAAGSSAFSEDFKLVPYGTNFNGSDMNAGSGWNMDGISGLLFDNAMTQTASGMMAMEAMLLDGAIDLVFSLALAEAAGESRVISSPRVVTLDNTKASVLQGVTIPYVSSTEDQVTTTFVNAFLELEVTPHITADRSIIMKLKVTRNAPDDSVPADGVAIAKNEAETEALVKDGQTLVLGGIYVLSESNKQRRLPYLHKIPIVGLLFKNRDFRDIRKELLVFVTPRIVRSPAVTG